MSAPATPEDMFDLLIIGGGINGAGVARDAVGRGLRTALVEQYDLAAGTSSSSTKLIHGGLRYLEFFEFRLVRESLTERETLLRIAPHIVHPLDFVLPYVRGRRPRWQIRAGLFLYDHLGARKRLPDSRALRRSSGLFEPLKQDVEHGFAYADCWVDDSRLVVLNAMDAAERGALVRTRTQFVSARPDNGLWLVRCREANGREFEIRSRSIVNAAGPWVDRVLHGLPQVHSASQVRLIKGSHIVVPRLYEGANAFLLQNPDGRVTFTIPFEGAYTLVGTTDAPFHGDPKDAQISNEEIAYLCEAVNRDFVRSISPHDVRWTFAGVRPLLDDKSEVAAKITRDYRLELHRSSAHPPVLSIFGGKITTYRRLAESVLHKLQPHIGGSRTSWTHASALPGGDLPDARFAPFLQAVQTRWPFLRPELALRLARAYGTRVERILGAAARMEDLGEHYGAGLTEAELRYLRTYEWALETDDVLWRRTKLGLHLSAAERDRLSRAAA